MHAQKSRAGRDGTGRAGKERKYQKRTNDSLHSHASCLLVGDERHMLPPRLFLREVKVYPKSTNLLSGNETEPQGKRGTYSTAEFKLKI